MAAAAVPLAADFKDDAPNTPYGRSGSGMFTPDISGFGWGGNPLLDESLVAYYPLDGSAEDSSGQGNHGAAVNLSYEADRFGQPAHACRFNGTGYVVVPDSASFNDLTTRLSIATWLRIDPGTQYRVYDHLTLVSKGATYGHLWSDFALSLTNPDHAGGTEPQGALQWENADGGNVPFWQYLGTPLPEGTWVHVAVTFDNQDLRLYVDGTLRTNVAGPNPLRTSSQPLYLGCRYPSPFLVGGFTGLMDDVRIYSRALDAAEVRQLASDNGLTDSVEFATTGQRLGSGANRDVAAGDLNGDGHIDLVIINSQGQPAEVWLGDGKGYFTDSGQRLGSFWGISVTLGDLDGDGDLDLVLLSGAGPATSLLPHAVYLNNGSGRFTDSGLVLENHWGHQVKLGDLDGDGDLDAFVVNQTSAEVWLNDGHGRLIPTGTLTPIPAGHGLALGDVDRDGDLDALVANYDGYPAQVLLNDGHGAFVDSGQRLGDTSTGRPGLADLDGDGDLDLVLGNSREPTTIWLNDGAGRFTDSGQRIGGELTRDVGLADFDGNGTVDVLLAKTLGAPNELWLNAGHGHLVFRNAGLTAANAEGIAVADLDHDGAADLVIPDVSRSGATVWLNRRSPAPACDTVQCLVDAAAPGATINLTHDYTEAGITVAKDLTLRGPPGGITIDAAAKGRVLHVLAGATVVLENLSLVNGLAGTEADGKAGNGGGIWNEGLLTLNNCAVTSNRTVDDTDSFALTGQGGGIFNQEGAHLVLNTTIVVGNHPGRAEYAPHGGDGGGIANRGVLVMNGGALIQNTSGRMDSAARPTGVGGGLANFGIATLSGATLYANTIPGEESGGRRPGGAGAFNEGQLTLIRCEVVTNLCAADNDNRREYSNHGAGIYSAGGSIFLQDTLIQGNQVEGHGSGAGVYLVTGTATLQHTRIIGNAAGGNNTASLESRGGGLFNQGAAVTLTECTIEGNIAAGANELKNGLIGGGGIYNGGSMQVVRCTVARNLVGRALPESPGGNGGGILNAGDLVLESSTVCSNRAGIGHASAPGNGGGLYNLGTAHIAHCTVSGNTAGPFEKIDFIAPAGSGGGLANASGATLVLQHTIVAGNQLSPGEGATGPDVLGTMNSEGYNLIGVLSGGVIAGSDVGSIHDVDAMLGPLQDNGGPTETMALSYHSPALNAGDPGFAPPPDTDQRGQQRVWGGRIDIGAFEFEPPHPPTISAIPDQHTTQDTPTPPIPFTVDDAVTPVEMLRVSVTSSNPDLVDAAGLVLGGQGRDRTLVLIPRAGRLGLAEIAVTVEDDEGGAATTRFTIAVAPAVLQVATFITDSPISIPDVRTATPYPSPLQVQGVTGLVSHVTLILQGLTHTYPDDIDMLLVSPSGHKVIVMSDVGGGVGAVDVNLILDDAAGAPLPDRGPLVSGTFRPTNIDGPVVDDFFRSPAPPPPYAQTLAAFDGRDPNGLWMLYINDDSGGDHGTIRAWGLTFGTSNSPPTIGTIQDQTIAAGLASGPIGFRVWDRETPDELLELTATSSDPGLFPEPSAFVFQGHPPGPDLFRSLRLVPAAGRTGDATVTVTVRDPGGMAAQTQFHVRVVASNYGPTTYSHAERIIIPDAGIASPYPASVEVTGMAGALKHVAVTLEGLSHTYIGDVDVLLVAPSGQGVLVLSDVGGNWHAADATVVLDDDAGSGLPERGALDGGTYRPRNYDPGVSNDYFRKPAPKPPYASTLGSLTGINPNGRWSLFINDDSGGDHGQLLGWSLRLENDPASPAAPELTRTAEESEAEDRSPPFLPTKAEGEGRPWSYQLLEGSTLLEDCPICDHIPIVEPMRGTFDLRFLREDPLYTYYTVENVQLTSRWGDGLAHQATGAGTYKVGGEVAWLQELVLDLLIDNGTGARACHLTNAVDWISRPLPMMDASAVQSDGTQSQVYHLDIKAAPLVEVWFSTGTGLTPGALPVPRPFLGDGDLLSSAGNRVRSLSELAGTVGIPIDATSPGLDAVDVRPGGEILFSLAKDAKSPLLGLIQHGDLLSTSGRILRRNQDLTRAFSPMPPAPDAGLDAVQALDDGQLLFSIQKPLFSEALGRMLRPGDLLSSKGTIVRENEDLVGAFKPADPSVDYGLDAVHVWPSGEIWFSVANGFQGKDGQTYAAGDLLSDRGYVVRRNLELLGAFQPLEKLADFGLDALYVVSDATAEPSSPVITRVHRLQDGSVELGWKGEGRVWRLWRSASVLGPWTAVGHVMPDASATDSPADAVSGFYQVEQW
jgi:subtilisin-like proprotein convertase family protein